MLCNSKEETQSDIREKEDYTEIPAANVSESNEADWGLFLAVHCVYDVPIVLYCSQYNVIKKKV